MRFSHALFLVLVTYSAGAGIINRPYLQAVTQNSVYVLVECTSADTALVDYGLSNLYGNNAVTEIISPTTASPTTYVHKIELPGLTPDTVYHYRVSQSGSVSLDSWFRTAKPRNRSFRFAWMADSRTNSGIFDLVSNLVYGKLPAFLLLGGDVCVNGSYSAWQSEFFRANALTLISHVPFFFATGNHEGWATNAIAFTRAPASASNSQDYFSFDYGDVHFLVLDTEVSYAPGSPQYIFAQNDLAATTQVWKVVACHKPAYCSGGHGEDAGMKVMTTNIFEPSGVDLVIGGHSHFYQHNFVRNLHHLVIGTSGAPLYVPTNASYTLRSVQDYNYAIVDVTPTSLRLTVYNSSDAVLDTLQFSKTSTHTDEQNQTPSGFRLMQNHPNPFNPSTSITFNVPSSTFVTLKVYDVLGREVKTVVNRELKAGSHQTTFDATGLASGVYFYRLQTPSHMETRRMLLAR